MFIDVSHLCVCVVGVGPVASDSDDAECSIVDEVSPRKVEKALCSRRGTCGRPSAPKNRYVGIND